MTNQHTPDWQPIANVYAEIENTYFQHLKYRVKTKDGKVDFAEAIHRRVNGQAVHEWLIGWLVIPIEDITHYDANWTEPHECDGAAERLAEAGISVADSSKTLLAATPGTPNWQPISNIYAEIETTYFQHLKYCVKTKDGEVAIAEAIHRRVNGQAVHEWLIGWLVIPN